MRKFIVLVMCVTALVGCTDPEGAREALLNEGITPTKVGGYALFGCGKDDDFATLFEGKRDNGRKVKGAVCSGWFKGHTIRYY